MHSDESSNLTDQRISPLAQSNGIANLAGFSLPEMFEKACTGIAYCKMIYEGGRPVDFQYLYTNPAFHQMTRLGPVSGKCISEVIPGIQQSDPWLIETYGRVATTGQPESFENFLVGLQHWFSVQAFCPQSGYFIAIFSIVTGRKEYEAKLRKSEALARSIVDASPVPSAVNDNTGNVIYLNAAFIETFGYTPEDLHALEDWWPKAYPDPQYRQWVSTTWQEHLDEVRATGAPFKPLELKVRCKSGETKTILASATPLEGTDIERGLHLVTLYDISERGAMERALRESEETLQRAQAVAHIGSFAMGANTETFQITKETARLFDLDASGVTTFGEWFSRVHPDDQAAVEMAWRTTLRGAPYDMTYRIVVRGQIIWIRAFAELEFDEQGCLVRAVGTVQDISDLKWAEAKLQQQKEELDLALDSARMGIWEFDLATRRICWSPGIYKYLGLAVTEPNENNFSVMDIHPDDVMRLKAAMEAAITQRSDYHEEYRIVVSGQIRWVEDRGRVICDAKGRPVRVVGTSMEITQRKLIETELQRYRNQLETQGKQVAQALIRTEEQLHLATNGANIGIWYWPMRGGKIVWSDLCKTMLALPPDREPSFEHWHSVLHPEDRARVEALLKDAVERNGDYQAEYRVVHSDGTIRWLSAPGRVFIGLDGQPAGMGGVLMDITEHKLALEAMRSSEERLRRVSDNADVGLTRCSRDLTYLSVNPTYAKIAGKPFDQIVGHPIVEVIGEEAMEMIRPYIERVLSGEHVTYEAKLPFAGAGERYLHVSYSPDIDTEGKIAGWIACVTDITGQKRAEEHIRALSQAIEQSPESIVITDRNANIQYVNDAFLVVSGYSREEVIGKNPRILHSGKTRPETYAELWDALTQGRAWSGEFYNKRKDGTEYIEFAKISPIQEADGSITRYVGVKEDITEHRKNEAALQALEGEMERLMLFQVARQTIAAIAHQLNQPLSAVVAYAEVALRLLRAADQQPDKLRQVLENCTQQAQRAGDVVRELFDFMNHGKVEAKPFDLNKTVNSVMKRVARDDYGSVDFDVDLAHDLPPVLANALQVEKVLLNLIENGIQGMRDAGVAQRTMAITVRTVPDGTKAQVTVTDSGPGIDADILNRIFDPFFTTKPTGLGMGLAISRAIIEAHGGRLWAESESGVGTCFHFTLPFAHE